MTNLTESCSWDIDVVNTDSLGTKLMKTKAFLTTIRDSRTAFPLPACWIVFSKCYIFVNTTDAITPYDFLQMQMYCSTDKIPWSKMKKQWKLSLHWFHSYCSIQMANQYYNFVEKESWKSLIFLCSKRFQGVLL